MEQFCVARCLQLLHFTRTKLFNFLFAQWHFDCRRQDYFLIWKRRIDLKYFVIRVKVHFANEMESVQGTNYFYFLSYNYNITLTL
jgi:hypothetical protein